MSAWFRFSRHSCISSSSFFILMRPPPPCFTLFPYTTLFRSFSVIFSFLAIFHVLQWTFLNFPPFSVDRKSTRLNSSHLGNLYDVLCLTNKNFDCFIAPDSHTFAVNGMIDFNWLQSLEVCIDP